MRFSGHETFSIRYAWLPKAYRALADGGQTALSDDEDSMVRLGVGKNMVRAVRFWIQATGMATSSAGTGYELTDFAHAIFGSGGHDPYLEDVRTLWLIHWRLCQNTVDPIFAWDHLINRWHLPEISRSEVLPVMRRESELATGRALSDVTLAQHFDVFIRTYVPTRSRKADVLEDSLDSPLAELEFIREVGARPVDQSGHREAVYAFRREVKPEITPGMFVYCLEDFWAQRHHQEEALGFRELSVGRGGPGQVFKLPEQDLRERLDMIERDSGGLFAFRESSATPQIVRQVPHQDPRRDEEFLLREMYAVPPVPVLAHG
jgi:hypothetical protein